MKRDEFVYPTNLDQITSPDELILRATIRSKVLAYIPT